MAVDTAQKRAALVAFVSPFPFPALVPDSSIDERDRAALVGVALPTVTVGGSPVDAPAVAAVPIHIISLRRPNRR